MSFELIENPGRDPVWTTPPTGRPPARALHAQWPGYEEAPLLEVPELAEDFGVGAVLLKDERDAAVALRMGSLPASVRWADVVPVAVLGGIGYTVSLLVARLASSEAREAELAEGVLGASAVAALVAVMLLRRRPSAQDRAA